MKPETILNQYDGPSALVKHLPPTGPISLDYVNSDNAEEIDSGIRKTIRGVKLSILAMGIALARFKEKQMFVDLRFHSMNDYLESLCDDMQIDRSTAHNWLHIGESWLVYRKELERIDFTEADGPTKLPYVPKALEIHEKKEVFRNVKGMSLRAFKEYSREEEATPPLSKVRVIGNQLFVGKKLAVTFSEDLDSKTRSYLAKINIEAGGALEAGEVLYTTRLYDMDELRRFERRADRLKKDMRKRQITKKIASGKFIDNPATIGSCMAPNLESISLANKMQ